MSSWSGGRPKEPADQFGDALASLTVDTIRRVYRNNLNRGEYTRPCFALHEAARVCPIVVDKVSFWTASISGLDWSIHQTGFDKKDDAERARAKKQADALRNAYDQMDVKSALRHLALAKFYGFSVLVKKGLALEPLDWWNLLRDGRYGAWYWNGDLRKSSAFGNPGDLSELPLDQMILREVEDNLLLVSLSIFYEYDKLNNWWNLNLEQESKRQVVILAGNGILDKDAFKTAASDMSDGKSGWLEKGGYSGGPTTEVLFPPASRGLGNFDIRAKVLDETLTKALTGGVLSMLTAPGSGTLAGSVHSETLHTIIGAEAAAISAILQDQYDRPILEADGLLRPGERPLAYFELTNRRIIDPGTIINWAASLATAQYRIDLDELSERTGMKLIEAPTQPTQLPGREPTLQEGGGGLDDLSNANDNHDELGRFADAPGGGGGRTDHDATMKAHDEAIKKAKGAAKTKAMQAKLDYMREYRTAAEVSLAEAEIRRDRPGQLDRKLTNRGGRESDEQPSVALLQAIAAAGSLPDYLYTTPPTDLVNRAAESIGVPESWLGPVRKLLNDIAAKAPDQITPEYAAATLAEIKSRLPELFGEMDINAFADVLEEGMGAAAVEGVRDAIRKRAAV